MTERPAAVIPSRRAKLLVVVLLVSLLPLSIAAYHLARLPGPINGLELSKNRQFLLTNTYRNLEDELHDNRLLSLRDGREWEFYGAFTHFTDDQLIWIEIEGDGDATVKSLDLASFRESTMGTFNRRDFGMPWAANTSGAVAAVNKQNELCILDLTSHQMVSVALPPIKSTASHFWMPLWRGNPQRLLVTELSNGGTKGRERVLLYSVESGKLAKLSEWTAHAIPRELDDQFVSITADLNLEFRRAKDGELIESQSLRDTLSVPSGTLAYLGKGLHPLCHLHVRPGRNVIYDYQAKRIVLEPTLMNASFNDLHRDFFVTSEWGQNPNHVEVRRLADGSVIQRLALSRQVWSASLNGVGSQLTLVLKDESVEVYDVPSGRLLRTLRSRAWVWPTIAALAIGFSIWTWLSVRVSARVPWHPLWMVVGWNAVMLSGFLLRVFGQGSLRIPYRPIYLYCEALAANWLLLIALWFVFGRQRWTIRVLAPLLGLAGVLVVTHGIFRGSGEHVGEVVVAGVGVSLLMAVMLWLMRRWGWRLSDATMLPTPISRPIPRQLPLRDLFFITAAVAALFAAARFARPPGWNLEGAGQTALMIFTTSASAVIAAWGALSPRHWFVRLLITIAAASALGSVHSALFPSLANWFSWRWFVRLATLTATFTFVSLSIVRARLKSIQSHSPA